MGLVSTSIVAGGIVLASSFSAMAQTKLYFSNWIPTQTLYYKDVLEPWAKAVEEASEGRIDIEFTPKVVGTPQSQYDVAVDGLADVVNFVPGYNPGRFDLAGVMEVPFVSDNVKAGALATWRFYEQELKATGLFDEVHMLGLFPVSAGTLFTRGAPISTYEDFAGLKIRSGVPVATQLLERVGATPVAKPATEVYELLSTGVLDGTLAGQDQILGYRLIEVAGGMLEVPGGFYNSLNGIALSKDAWEKLSPEDQAAITSVSGEFLANLVGDAYDREVRNNREALVAKGTPVVIADETFVAKLHAAAEPIYLRYAEVARKAGLAEPDQAITRFRAEVAKATAEIAD